MSRRITTRAGRAPDRTLIGLCLAHAGVLLLWPGLLVVAIGSWWNANTVSHYFIHRPFFRGRVACGAFSVLLSLVLGFPQEVWRRRHLAHHAGGKPGFGARPQLFVDCGAIVALWTLLGVLVPAFFVAQYLPGLLLGQCLAGVHGYYEHAGGRTTSHYGRIYNLLFLNDGYHVEHHAHPGCDWRRLPQCAPPAARGSRWPAVLRFLEGSWLDLLERLVLWSPPLQRWVVRRHERAFGGLLPTEPARIGIVGGGLFPRTALVLRRLCPHAELTLIDADAANLAIARRFLGDSVTYVHAWFDPAEHDDFDALVVPLAFRGDRQALYDAPPADRVLVHDWLWRRRGESRIVSPWLGKRVNLVRGAPRNIARCKASA